jgi:hypothetical protein
VDPGALVMLVPLGGMAVSALFLVGVYKLTVRWMDRRHAPGVGPADAVELDRLRQQVTMLEDLPHRVEELEERLDFAERMLAQQKHERLASGE